MITWNVSAQFYRHINLASVNIPLHSFLKDFKLLDCKIVDDTLVLGFAHSNHYFCKDVMVVKPLCKEVALLK